MMLYCVSLAALDSTIVHSDVFYLNLSKVLKFNWFSVVEQTEKTCFAQHEVHFFFFLTKLENKHI